MKTAPICTYAPDEKPSCLPNPPIRDRTRPVVPSGLPCAGMRKDCTNLTAVPLVPSGPRERRHAEVCLGYATRPEVNPVLTSPLPHTFNPPVTHVMSTRMNACGHTPHWACKMNLGRVPEEASRPCASYRGTAPALHMTGNLSNPRGEGGTILL